MDKLEKALQKARAERAGEKTPPQAPSALPSGGIVLSDEVLEKHRLFAQKTRSPEADRIRILRTHLLQAMDKGGFKTVAVTSPDYGDGKTTIAINLAMSIAMDLNQTVLLVDLDLRKPCVAAYLELPPQAGLTNHLIEGTPLPDCLTRLSFERMSVLPSGTAFDNSSEILRSPQMASLANELRSRYPDRLIIYDMPPILAQDDPMAFLPHIDAVLLVVQEGKTKIDSLKKSLGILTGSRLIGTVLNKSDQVRASKPKWLFSWKRENEQGIP